MVLRKLQKVEIPARFGLREHPTAWQAAAGQSEGAAGRASPSPSHPIAAAGHGGMQGCGKDAKASPAGKKGEFKGSEQ